MPYSVVFRSMDLLRGYNGGHNTTMYKSVVQARTDSLSSLNYDPPALLYNLDDRSQDYSKRILNTRYNGEGTGTSFDRVDSAYKGHFIGDTDDFKELPLSNTSGGINQLVKGRSNMYEMYANTETDTSVPLVPVTGDYLQGRTLDAQISGAHRREYSDNLLGLRPMRQLPPSANQRFGHYGDQRVDGGGWISYIDDYSDVRATGPTQADSGLLKILGSDGSEGTASSKLADYGEFNRARLMSTFKRFDIHVDESLDDRSLYSTIKGHPILNSIASLSLVYSPQELDELLLSSTSGPILRRASGLPTQKNVAALQTAEQLNSYMKESIRAGGVRAAADRFVAHNVQHDVPFSTTSYVDTIRSIGAAATGHHQRTAHVYENMPEVERSARPQIRSAESGSRVPFGVARVQHMDGSPHLIDSSSAAPRILSHNPTGFSSGVTLSVHASGGGVEHQNSAPRRRPLPREGPLARMSVWGPHQEF